MLISSELPGSGDFRGLAPGPGIIEHAIGDEIKLGPGGIEILPDGSAFPPVPCSSCDLSAVVGPVGAAIDEFRKTQALWVEAHSMSRILPKRMLQNPAPVRQISQMANGPLQPNEIVLYFLCIIARP